MADEVSDRYIIAEDGVGDVTLTEIKSGIDGETYYEIEVAPLSEGRGHFVVFTRDSMVAIRDSITTMLEKERGKVIH